MIEDHESVGELMTARATKKTSTLSSSEMLMMLSQAESIANVGSWVWYPSEDRVIWSDQLYKILGFDLSVKASAEKYFEAIHPDDREAHMQASKEAIATNDADKTFDCRVLLQDGTIRNVRVKGVAINLPNGQIEKIVGTIIDVTSEKQQEADRLRSEKLRSINTLAAGVAHDFNNYLQVITGSVGIIKKSTDFGGNEFLQQKLHMVGESAKLCSDMIKKMVQLSANKFEGDKQIFTVESALKEMNDLLTVIVGKKIAFKAEIEKDIAIEMNKIEFNQMLVNLVKNAKLAILDNGSIDINGKIIKLPANNRHGLNAGDYIAIEVIDSGCGIDEADLAQIFDPFFTTRRTTGGSGLGLSGVYSILQKYQGAIEVKSVVNVGTTFIIYLKIVDKKNVSHSEIVNISDLKNQKINLRALYLEDLKDLREVMTDTLTEAGYQIINFPRPSEALSYIGENGLDDIDIILSDVSMPYMSGVDFAQKIWERYPQMKFVFITGFFDQSIFEKIKDNVNQFIVLAKPTTIEEINRAVLSLLGRSIAQRAS